MKNMVCYPLVSTVLMLISWALSAQIPTDGLVGYWQFNGNAFDLSGNGNNGIVHGATLTIDRFGNTNSAYYFNGVDNYIEVPNSPVLNFGSAISFTVNVWVKPAIIGNDIKGLVAKERPNGSPPSCGWQFGLYASNVEYSHFGNADTAAIFYGSQGLSVNTWYMVTWVVDRTLEKSTYYINGLFDSQLISQYYNENVNNDYPMYFGIDRTLLPWYFLNGSMDAIRIFNRVLSEDEIIELFNEGPATGFGENSHSTLAVYPNPTNGMVKVESDKNLRRINVYNSLGELVLIFNTIPADGRINLTGLGKGIYVLKLESENSQSVFRVVVY